jgi:hypothetical protein
MLKNKKLLLISGGILVIIMAIFTFSPISFSDIQYLFVKKPIEASLAVDRSTITAETNPPPKINIEQVDKANIVVSFNNNTKNEIKNAQVSLIILNKDKTKNKDEEYLKTHFGSTTTNEYSLSSHRYGTNNAVIDVLKPLKPGEKRTVTAYIFSATPGDFEIQAGIVSPQYSVKTDKVEVTFK